MHHSSGSPYITGHPFLRPAGGNWHLPIATDSFKWLQVYATPKQDTSTAADVQVTNFFCSCGIQREMHGDLGQNFESRPLQEVSQCSRRCMKRPFYTGKWMAWWTSIRRQWRNIRGRSFQCIREEWDDRLSPFLLPYTASSHEITGTMTSSSVWVRATCDLWPAVWGSCQQGAAHDQLHSRPHRTAAWTPSLWLLALKVVKTGQRPAMTTQSTPQDTKQETKAGCTAWPAPEESCLCCGHPWKDLTRWWIWSTV
jgi:hypothetical protein